MKEIAVHIEAHSLMKRFGRNILFRDVNLTLKTGDSFYITGPNGSGKSTLLKILAGLQGPTTGRVEYSIDGKGVHQRDILAHIGFTSPQIFPYDDLTGRENCAFIFRESRQIDGLLDHFKLAQHENKRVRFYSSGMKQRLKIILALLKSPPIIFLDEPGSNLDEEGRDSLFSYIETVRKRTIIIVATNDKAEELICSEGIRLG